MKHKLLVLLSISLFNPSAQAEWVLDKPSFYNNPITMPVKTQTNALAQIKNQQQFDLLSRNYNANTAASNPHILFLIERATGKMEYINTPKFNLHENFLRQVKGLNPSKNDMRSYYASPTRRFIFGTMSWQPTSQQFVYEFWEGDKITPELLRQTDDLIKQSFFQTAQYKSNSVWQEMVAKQANVPFVSQESLLKDSPYIALNTGKAVGVLRVIASDDDIFQAGANDIVLLKDVPLTMPPVAGVISEKPSTALSHVNVLSKSWGIPSIYLKDAEKILAPYVNRSVALSVDAKQYQIAPAKAVANNKKSKQNIKLPKINTTDLTLHSLDDLRRKDSLVCGSKAANLGEVKAKISGSHVPQGFCIPFGYYAKMMTNLGIDEAYLSELERSFGGDNQKRREGLVALQQRILNARLPENWANEWAAAWQSQLGGRGVFVRSSSNSEDLPNFSGAGLYTTVPNVKSAQNLAQAVKQSWASVFNYSAYEARRAAGLPSSSVNMAVLVQVGVNADLSGVLVTTNPYHPTERNSSYIAAKRGIGIRVVEGKRLAEQVLYNHRAGSIALLSQSNETTALQLDERGGVVEVPLQSGQRVLSDGQVKQLATMGRGVQKLFGTTQDIEWAFAGKDLMVLQARPYVVK
ncbi:PEP/pyruvate-binding domain-containing protein [Neisseriaceae bacterium B1]